MQESGFFKLLFSCAISYSEGSGFQSPEFLISFFILDSLHGVLSDNDCGGWRTTWSLFSWTVGSILCFTQAFSVACVMEKSISPGVLSLKGWSSGWWVNVFLFLWWVNVFLFSLCDKGLTKMQMSVHILSEFVLRAQLQAVIRSPVCSCSLCALLGRGGLSLGWLLVLFWLGDNPQKNSASGFFQIPLNGREPCLLFRILPCCRDKWWAWRCLMMTVIM